MLLWLLLVLGQAAPLNGYNVGLWAVGGAGTPLWQQHVPLATLTCVPTSSIAFNPDTTTPRVAVLAEGFIVGLNGQAPNEYCFTAPLKATQPGQYEVRIQSVVTTPSGTVYGAWVTAIPQLTLQLEPIVPCAVSGWDDWTAWSEWMPRPPGKERKRTRSRLVTVPASGGGTPCPALVETEVETQNIPDPVTATAVKADGATQGTWQGVYGAQGAVLAGYDAAPPLTSASVTVQGATTHIWAASTTEPRALQKPGASDRIAAAWYSATSFVIDIRFTDQQQHQVAVYLLDYDDRGRQQAVEVLDSMDGSILPAQAVTSFGGGRYLVYLLSGHAHLRIFNNNPALNGLASGVFFDAPSVTPINCAVSNWVEGTWGPWTPLNSTTEQRTMTRTRTVTTPPSGGGAACPALSETLTETRPIATLSLESSAVRQCLVTLSAPPPPNTEPGWEAWWYVDSALFATDPTAPYTGLVQVAVGSHAFQVRWTRPETLRSWWRRLVRAPRAGAVVYDPVTFVCS